MNIYYQSDDNAMDNYTMTVERDCSATLINYSKINLTGVRCYYKIVEIQNFF